MADWQTNTSKRLILDNGSWEIRLGSATSSQPSLTYHNLLGIDRNNGNLLIGDNLKNYIDEVNLIYIKPQVRGVVVDWDHEVHLWEKIYISKEEVQWVVLSQKNGIHLVFRLDIQTEFESKQNELSTYSLSLIHNPFMPDKVRQRMVEVCFEYFGFDAMYPALSQQMSQILATDKHAKKISDSFQLVIEIGHSATYFVPFFDGQPINYAIKRLDIESYSEKLTLDKERFTIPEVLFNPSDIGLDQNGISQGIHSVGKKIHGDIREYFFENIILTGGSSNFPGLKERLQSEVMQNTPDYLDNKLIHLKNTTSAFQGCQKVTKADSFGMLVMKRSDYNEFGFEQLNQLYFI